MFSQSFPKPSLTVHRNFGPALGHALGLALGLAVAGCSSIPSDRGLDSIHQPVVERQQFVLDLTSGPGGLSAAEKGRLSGWFEALKLRNGDKVAVDDPLTSAAAHEDVAQVAGRFGILIGGEAPVTSGFVNAGTLRVILSRSVATVPHCPDWRDKIDANPLNATSRNFGCAVNGNLATMVADPENLIKGVNGNSGNSSLSATKAVNAYRSSAPSGNGGSAIKSSSSKGS